MKEENKFEGLSTIQFALNNLTGQILGCAYEVHTALGPGL